MKLQKPLLVLGAVTGITVAGLTGLGVASAASSSGQDSIIDKLASRFNLNRDEVAAVFQEAKTEHQAERQQKLDDRLAQAVKDGKITEEQKAKILAKLDELRKAQDTWKDKTPEERMAAKQELHSQLQQWAKDNGIPLEFLMPMRGHGHGWMHGDASQTEN